MSSIKSNCGDVLCWASKRMTPKR
ncbi:hypothetical protein F383_20302 [Gossypium arboreum]|uniref:Uncharacterized protein n=1 Tax=Gossypium arboreum TaxID=29729 RepID=A0A0B0NMJ5_GOSAR|nr:hypothetical protein F383_20302 [Gossypium arboreum]